MNLTGQDLLPDTMEGDITFPFKSYAVRHRVLVKLLLSNDLSNGYTGWLRYGYPLPVITTFPGSETPNTLDNNGDSSYHSLACTADPIVKDNEPFFLQFRTIQKDSSQPWDYSYIGLGNKPVNQNSYPDYWFRVLLTTYKHNSYSATVNDRKIFFGPYQEANNFEWYVFGIEAIPISPTQSTVRFYVNDVMKYEVVVATTGKDLHFIDTGRSYSNSGRLDWFTLHNKRVADIRTYEGLPGSICSWTASQPDGSQTRAFHERFTVSFSRSGAERVWSPLTKTAAFFATKNNYIAAEYVPNNKVMTYLISAQASTGHSHYAFLFGDAANTYSVNDYGWFFSLYGTSNQFAIISGRLGTLTPQNGDLASYVVEVDHSTGAYKVWRDNGEYAEGTNAILVKSASKVQFGAFTGFNTTYAKDTRVRHFSFSEGSKTSSDRAGFFSAMNYRS